MPTLITELHNYSQFVNAAYVATGLILLVSAFFFLLQLKQNETAFKKNQSKKTAKN
jgi:hypothetical protein